MNLDKAYYGHKEEITVQVSVGTDTVGGQATGVFYFNGVEKPDQFPITRGVLICSIRMMLQM